jgi:hypothetical protein
MKNNYTIIFPENYTNDEYIQLEAESKGYLRGVVVIINDVSYTITFYDSVRLRQDIEEELNFKKYFFESNLVIVECINKNYISEAINELIKNDEFKFMDSD